MLYNHPLTEGEQEWHDWVMSLPPVSINLSNRVMETDQLERLLTKEERLKRMIENKKRAKRRRQKRLDASQLTIKEVGECLTQMLTVNESTE